MSEEEKEELKHIEKFIRSMGLLKEANLILKTQKELDKKDKVIDELLYQKAQSVLYDCKEEEILKYKEELKQKYFKEVEETNELL